MSGRPALVALPGLAQRRASHSSIARTRPNRRDAPAAAARTGISAGLSAASADSAALPIPLAPEQARRGNRGRSAGRAAAAVPRTSAAIRALSPARPQTAVADRAARRAAVERCTACSEGARDAAGRNLADRPRIRRSPAGRWSASKAAVVGRTAPRQSRRGRSLLIQRPVEASDPCELSKSTHPSTTPCAPAGASSLLRVAPSLRDGAASPLREGDVDEQTYRAWPSPLPALFADVGGALCRRATPC